MEILFDPRRVLLHKLRALRQFGRAATFLMEEAAHDLELRLSTVGRTFEKAAVLHGFTDDAAKAVAASGKAGAIVRFEADAAFLDGWHGGGRTRITPVDDLGEPGESFDLAVSLYGLGEVNDLPGSLIQIRRLLRPDGLFLGCLAGAGMLRELRDCLLRAESALAGGAAPRVHPFTDIRDAGALLQRAGFALPVADLEEVTVRYGSAIALMHDLRAMGMTSSLAAGLKSTPRRDLFLHAAEIYQRDYADPDGRVRATFSTIWVSGWAPHHSQQKPLKRGSAKVSLAEALKPPTDEG